MMKFNENFRLTNTVMCGIIRIDSDVIRNQNETRKETMKKTKVIISLILCVLMVVSLFSCNSGNGGDETTEAPETTEAIGTTAEAETTAEGEVATVYYDDYLTAIGKVSASAENVKIEGDSLKIVEVAKTKHFQVVGMSEATVSDGTNTVKVTVEKAKINIVVIMGQSNSGNHFANATSDIKCARGTAYWWGNGQGLNASAPVHFTSATKGFHAPLLAELYAQSVANGAPEKNVLVWHEGGLNGEGTSKNGSPITGWATSATESAGTDFTVKMVNKCVDYYKSQSDKFEIGSKGVYWLQGEGDGVKGIDPTYYTECFMAMWNKLKTEAGLEYMAIMRVRRGGDSNTLNNDIHYSTTSSSQFALANKYDDIFIATTITENFTGAPTEKKTISIKNYITMMETYGNEASHNDSYGNEATYANGKLTTPMKTLFGSNNNNHYGKFGYALIGVDAAYNMYNALHGKDFSITRATSSGKPAEQKITEAGKTVEIDITEMVSDLAFRATPGSVAGTISFKITSGTKDITNDDGVFNAKDANYACVNVKKLKSYDDVKIVVTYTPKNGTAGSVTYNIKDTSIDLEAEIGSSYVWDFDTDLFARNSEGKTVNAFLEKALNGTYKIEGGMLKTTKAQLEIARVIELDNDKNWSIEIKFGDTTGSSGFILASKIDNVVGNKALSYRGGKLNISNYADGSLGKGYYNYASDGAAISSGCVMKLVNTYDETTKKSVLSLYRDGVLVVEDIQNGTGDYNGGNTGMSMSAHPLDSTFDLAYLGCSNSSGSFLLSVQIDYIKVETGK